MFTERFLKLPIDLYNKQEADMMGYKEETRSGNTVMRLLPFEISHYRPSNSDNEEMLHTLVYTKSGENFYTTLNIEEFEKLLNSHDNKS